jgi:hypothetical protein
MPAELARREALKAKLDAACARMEAEARAKAAAERANYEAKKGRRGRPPKPPGDEPPPEPKKARRVTEPWRIAMMAKLQTDDAKALYSRRKHTVEPVFGIIKSVLGFRRFRLRGLQNVATEWSLIALAYNCKRLNRLQTG